MGERRVMSTADATWLSSFEMRGTTGAVWQAEVMGVTVAALMKSEKVFFRSTCCGRAFGIAAEGSLWVCSSCGASSGVDETVLDDGPYEALPALLAAWVSALDPSRDPLTLLLDCAAAVDELEAAYGRAGGELPRA